MGDRSGGREPKGVSLKKSKKNPGASAAKAKKAPQKAQGVVTGPNISQTPPQLRFPNAVYFDAGIALLSRQFDRDRDRVIERAQTEGQCFGLLAWFADIEKQQGIADLGKANEGFCYFAVGIHPDNIDRTNKKSHEEWLEKVEKLGKRPECLAVLSGLNLSREMATHFSQESLLKSSYVLASKLQLPLILHVSDPKSLDRALELLLEDNDISGHDVNSNILIHDAFTCSGGEVHRLFGDTRVHFMLSGAGLTDADESIRQTVQTFARALDVNRIVIGTDGPWRTPQNLPDLYLRTVRNESANLPYIALALSESLGMDRGEMETLIKANSLRLFGLEFIENHANIALPAAAAAAEKGEAENECQEDEEEDEESHDLEEIGKLIADVEVSSAVPPPPTVATHASPPQPPVIQKKDNKKTAATSLPSCFYTCSKCRTPLFYDTNVLTHTLTTTKKAVYKAGEEGLCTSFVFANVLSLIDASKKTSTLEVVGSSVDCKQCGLKLGKYYPAEGVCSCGKTVPGPVAKLLASKLDCIDKTMDTQALAQRAMLENSMLPAEDMSAAEGGEKKKIKKGKKHKSDNKGNFSNFRNKSFVPNASKAKRSGEEVEQEAPANEEDEHEDGSDSEDGH